MLSRLPISSAQLKAGNNSHKLQNEIRQLLYFYAPFKKTYKTTLYEQIFMNTENSKANESHKFGLYLSDKLNLKNPNKYNCIR